MKEKIKLIENTIREGVPRLQNTSVSTKIDILDALEWLDAQGANLNRNQMKT